MMSIRLLRRTSLRVVLIVPFVMLICVAVGVTGYLAFRNGQTAVNEVSGKLRQEITARIAEHLRVFLAIPHQINQINENAIRMGLLDANDQNAMERYFWEQIQIFDEEKKFTLIVGDNGIGLPDGFDWRTTQSLGLQLVNLWATHQLRGTLEVDTHRERGTVFKVTFND